jgi:nucleolar protein 15
VVERIERHLPEGTMPKRAAAEAPAKGDAKKAKKAATPKRSAGTPGKGGSGGKRDVRGDDIIKLSDSDGADSDADVDARAIPVDVARKAAKKMKSKMKTNVHGAFGREKDDRPRVLYIGHVPHGFYEDQMRAYFGQFGEVTRLRLSRNKKTGKSKHYAYCEFKHPEVAAIVAESMDNYLLFESVLKVRLMTAEECHPELWKGANRKFKAVPWRRKAAEAHDKPRSAAELAKRDAALLAGERARRRKIEKAGIEYDFPGYAAAAKGGDAKSAKKTAKRAATKKGKTEENEAQTKATKAAKAPAKETKAPAKTPAKRKAPAAEAPAKKAKTPAKEKTPAKRATRSTRASAK